MTIVVIDDNDAVLRAICLMLRNNGHRVIATTDPLTALEAIEHDVVDLLITDVEMPILTGPDLLAAGRQVRPGLPVLFISGSERSDGNPLLLKPFDTHQLLAAIHSVVGRAVSASMSRG